jgi:Protein of unknown function (DUF1580)
MIDIEREKLLSLSAAALLIPPARTGKKTHQSTLLRWILQGSKGPNGERVRLKGRRIGGRWMVSREAIQRFMDRLTPNFDDGNGKPALPRTPTQRKRAHARAAKQLEKAGI